MSTDHIITVKQELSEYDLESDDQQDTMRAGKRKSFQKVAQSNGVDDVSTTKEEPPGVNTTCYLCNLVFRKHKSYIKHLSKTHQVAQSNGVDDVSTTEEEPPGVNTTCYLCNQVFRKHKSYIKHLSKTHQVAERNVVENNTDVTTTKEEPPGISSHMQVNTTCYLCKQVFGKRKSYIKHLAETHQVMSYQCPQCNRCISSRKLLKVHKKTVCAQPTLSTWRALFPCHLCPLEYRRKSDLQRHMFKVHGVGVAKSYECPRCGRAFTRKSSHREHFVLCGRQKTSDEPEARRQCDQCGKDFASKQSLSYHTRTIHRGETYTCDKCDKVFRWSKLYYAHLKLPCCNELSLANPATAGKM